MVSPSQPSITVGYVPGGTPAKWARHWTQRHPQVRLELTTIPTADAADALRAGTVDVAVLRLPTDTSGLAVIPLYVLGLLSAYLASRVITTVFNGQSGGSYDHYFNLFLPPADVLWSFGKVLVFAFVIILVHCYYGYYASGGPAGVGVAVGHAVRAALVLIAVLDFFLGLAIWGTTTTVRVGG